MFSTKLILLADDDPDDQELFEDAVLDKAPDVRMVKAGNGKEALEYLNSCAASELPCAILLDYSMPIINGVELLSRLCLHDQFKNIPKFVWSTSSAPVHIAECIHNGALKYFVKPDTPAGLDALTREIIDACSNYCSASTGR